MSEQTGSTTALPVASNPQVLFPVGSSQELEEIGRQKAILAANRKKLEEQEARLAQSALDLEQQRQRFQQESARSHATNHNAIAEKMKELEIQKSALEKEQADDKNSCDE